MIKFLFVGERPSKRAIEIGATWENAKLAGSTLRHALLHLNIDPEGQYYQNLWNSPIASPTNWLPARARN